MKVGQSFKHQEKTKESLAIQAKAELSEGMRHALTDPEDGMLRPGALPKCLIGRKQEAPGIRGSG